MTLDDLAKYDMSGLPLPERHDDNAAIKKAALWSEWHAALRRAVKRGDAVAAQHLVELIERNTHA